MKKKFFESKFWDNFTIITPAVYFHALLFCFIVGYCDHKWRYVNGEFVVRPSVLKNIFPTYYLGLYLAHWRIGDVTKGAKVEYE